MKIKRISGGSLEENGYIIYVDKGRSCYIIDPGYEGNRFIEFIEENQLKPEGIILTHHHYDHVGAVGKIRRHFDLPVIMHEIDSYMLKEKTDISLKDGDSIYLEDEELKIFHTPGHTAGSICILSEKSKVVFTGDTIFDTDLGRTDLEDGSPEDMVKSCRNVIDKWSNEYTIYPGHEGSATMKQVRKYNEEFLDCLK